MQLRPLFTSFSVVLALLSVLAGPAYAIDGELSGLVSDDFDSGHSDTRWRLDTGRETLTVLPTELPALAPGSNYVEVDGEREGNTVVGAVRPAALAATPTLGGRKTAVIVFNFADDTRQPWTPAVVRERVFTGTESTSAFFREESHNQLWLAGKAGNVDGDVYGYYTLPAGGSSCNFNSWASQAKAAAAADGFAAAGYQHVMYVFPGRSACNWAGLAYLPGSESWINGDLTVRVTGHEIGHNLGLNHAGSWNCTSGGAPVTLSSTCTVSEYNDPFDNMGSSGDRHSHGWHLERLGVLQPSNVKTITAPGTYSMTSALAPTAQPTTLRIPRTRDSDGDVLDWYYLEIRARGGVFDDFSLSDSVLGGVSIRVNDDPAFSTRSKLLDAHPNSGGIANAPLAPGETFSDGQVNITTVSANGGAATVRGGDGSAVARYPSAFRAQRDRAHCHGRTDRSACLDREQRQQGSPGLRGLPRRSPDRHQRLDPGRRPRRACGAARLHRLCRGRRGQPQRLVGTPRRLDRGGRHAQAERRPQAAGDSPQAQAGGSWQRGTGCPGPGRGHGEAALDVRRRSAA